jgi:hypothetical protein
MDHLVVGPVPSVGAVVLIIVRKRAASTGKLNGAARNGAFRWPRSGREPLTTEGCEVPMGGGNDRERR